MLDLKKNNSVVFVSNQQQYNFFVTKILEKAGNAETLRNQSSPLGTANNSHSMGFFLPATT